jgi:hypothetical protein
VTSTETIVPKTENVRRATPEWAVAGTGRSRYQEAGVVPEVVAVLNSTAAGIGSTAELLEVAGTLTVEPLSHAPPEVLRRSRTVPPRGAVEGEAERATVPAWIAIV